MIRKRGKGYEVQVYDPTLRRKVSVGTRHSKAEARDLEAQKRLEFGSAGRGAALTVEWYRVWLKDYPRPEETTNRHNRNMIGLFAKDFAGRRLDSIQPAEARKLAVERPHVAKVASAMYNDAERWAGYRGRNPFAKLGLEKSKGRQDITPLTSEEVEELADRSLEEHGLFGPNFRAMVLFAAWVGCRPGEMFGLRWSDLDFRRGEVLIERQRRVDGMRNRTKTGESRLVLMPDPAARAIREMGIRGHEWVFVTVQGKQFSKGSHRYYWEPVRRTFTAKLPASHWLRRRIAEDPKDVLDFYELRHHCGSWLADQGVSVRDIAYQLGNSVRVCETTYIHRYEDRTRERLRQAFGGSAVRRIGDNGQQVGGSNG